MIFIKMMQRLLADDLSTVATLCQIGGDGTKALKH